MISDSEIDFGDTDQVKQLKDGAGQLVNLLAFSLETDAVWVHIYDKATEPTPGTDEPTWRFPVNGGTASPVVWGHGSLPLHMTYPFKHGCWIAATTSQDHTVATAPAGDLVVNWTVN